MADEKFDMIPRGVAGGDLLGNTIFVGLRAFDPWLQWRLLLNSPIPHLARTLGLPSGQSPPSGGAPLHMIGLTPYQTVIWVMSVGSAAKHIFWKLVTAREPVYAGPAVAIALFNTFSNTVNTLIFNIAADNPTYLPPWSLYIGSGLYVTGLLCETIGEVQRNAFKNDPGNKNKVYSGGLFSIVRHVSYLGYSMWRAGYAMASGGPIWAAAVGGFFLWDFSARAIPVLDQYMTRRYGDEWSRAKRDVPYALIPGIW